MIAISEEILVIALALNILPIERLIFFRFNTSHSSDSKLIFLPIWDKML